jgi:hypothetical protein
VQTGRIQPACFGLVAQLSGTEQGCSTNDSASGGPAGSGLLAAGSVQGGPHLSGGQNREVLTGRMSSVAMCSQPEGNGGGGDVRGWWLTTLGAGRLYTATRC